MPQIIFSGFLVNVSSIPRWLGWIQYTSAFRYALEILFRNEYNESDFEDDWPVNEYNFNFQMHTCFIALGSITLFFFVLGFLSLKIQSKKS